MEVDQGGHREKPQGSLCCAVTKGSRGQVGRGAGLWEMEGVTGVNEPSVPLPPALET